MCTSPAARLGDWGGSSEGVDETTAPGERCASHFTGESVFLALPPNSSTSSFSLPLCLWLERAMATALHRFLWSALLLLPVFGLSVALPAGWRPGNYVATQADAQRFLDDYNSTAEQVLFHSVSASWNYNTNLTAHNSQLQVGPLLELPAWHVGWTFLSRWYDFWSPIRSSSRQHWHLVTTNACMVKGFCGAEPCLIWISPLFISLQNYMLSFLPAQPTQLVCHCKYKTDLKACSEDAFKFWIYS